MERKRKARAAVKVERMRRNGIDSPDASGIRALRVYFKYSFPHLAANLCAFARRGWRHAERFTPQGAARPQGPRRGRAGARCGPFWKALRASFVRLPQAFQKLLGAEIINGVSEDWLQFRAWAHFAAVSFK
jgi:hypothetical protein